MRKTFTKSDLHTGDIVETRNGERGVFIKELDCILYQAGGLDIFDEVFTDDLFVDGPQREGDIFIGKLWDLLEFKILRIFYAAFFCCKCPRKIGYIESRIVFFACTR